MPNVIVTRNTYPDAIALENVIHYVLDKAVVVGGYAVDCGSYAALEQMLFVKQAFRKSEALQLKHLMYAMFIISASCLWCKPILQETVHICECADCALLWNANS